MATLPAGVFADIDPTGGTATGVPVSSAAVPGHPNLVQSNTARQPIAIDVTHNGKVFTAWDFDGTDDFLSGSGTLLDAFRNTGGVTVVVVHLQEAQPSTTSSQQTVAWTTGSSTSSRRWSLEMLAGSQRFAGRRNDADATDYVSQGTTPALNVWSTRTAVMNYQAGTAALYRDGTLVASDAAWLTPGLMPDTASGAMYVGSLSTSQYLNGRIARILVWKRVLTDAERAEVHTVMQDTYGHTHADYLAPTGTAGPDQASKVPGEAVVLQATGPGTWSHAGSSVAGVAIALTATGVEGQATFEWPHLTADSVQTFDYTTTTTVTNADGTTTTTTSVDSMKVSGLRAQRRIRLLDGTWRPLRRELVQQGDLGETAAPDPTELLAVTNLKGFQVPGTGKARLEWTDPNIPAAAQYNVTETLFGGLDIYVTTLFRESGNLAPGNYLYHVRPVTAGGALGPAVSVPITIVSTAGPSVTSGTPVVGAHSWSVAHTVSPDSTVRGELRLSPDSSAAPVASYTLATAAASMTESYTGLEPSTTYYRTTTFTRADTGNVTTRSSTFTTSAPAAATIKYERLGPVLASDDSPLPAAWADWRKIRILSQTTYTIDDGPTNGFSGGISMPSGSNNLVIGPRSIALARGGGITFGGGHHLCVRNLEVRHDIGGMISSQDYYGTTMPPHGTTVRNQSYRKGMQVNQQTGHVELEGCYVYGTAINDPIWPNAAPTTITTGKRYYTFINCWFSGATEPNKAASLGLVDDGTQNPFGVVVDWSQNELHADAIQIMGNGTNTRLRFWRCRWDTGGKGIMDNMGDGVELEAEDLHINAVLTKSFPAGSRSISYSFFFRGPTEFGPGCVVRNPVRLDGFGNQRQVGYPEIPEKWANITQIVTDTAADAAWQATAWVGDQAPGRGYVAR